MQKEKFMKILEIFELLEDNKTVSLSDTSIGNGEIKIAILQRGWVAIGKFYRTGYDCTLKNAYWIRKWGTDKGLSQLAIEGRQSDTILDKSASLHFDYLTVVALIDCKEDLWKNEL
jgi:hypothetical protein